MKLAMASNREHSPGVDRDIESFVAEIQLYGNQRLTDLTGELVEKFKAVGWVSYDSLLKELRDQIREELELPQIKGEVWWIRFGKSPAQDDKTEKTKSDPPAGV